MYMRNKFAIVLALGALRWLLSTPSIKAKLRRLDYF